MAIILEGRSLGDSIRISLKERIEAHKKAGRAVPKLVILQVGDDPASKVFIRMKERFGQAIGAEISHKVFSKNISQEALKKEIVELNRDEKVNGIILQLPLPPQLDAFSLIESIDPLKDVDALHSKNKARGFLPATTRGILALVDHYKIDVESKNVLVIGRSELVGIPTALAMIKRNATVTIAHSKTRDIKTRCLEADVIISIVGKSGLISKDMVREGQIIIDVGISNKEGKVRGDASYEDVFPIVQAITPVPGGIGPLTVASIFENLFDLYDL